MKLTSVIPSFVAVSAALLIGFSGNASAQAPTVHLAGSITLVSKITAKKAELEAASGATLDLVPNTTLRGLIDLVEGRADIALIGGPWDLINADAQSKFPGKVDAASLTITPLKPSNLIFIVDGANSVKSVTQAQLADLLAGKIANWKDVGGGDVPVSLVVPPATNGFRIFLTGTLLKGLSLAPTAREISDLRNIPTIVSQLPGAIAFQSADIPLAGTDRVLATDKPLLFPLSLVTKKTPSPEAAKTVAALVAALGK